VLLAVCSTYRGAMEDLSEQQAREFLAAADVGHLAVIDRGRPYVTPMSFVVDGDTILLRRTGRSDFQNGDTGALYDSVAEKLLTLPPETKVYPCHDYQGRTMSTVEEERRLGTVGTMSREAFIEMWDAMDRPKPRKFDVAVPANLKCGGE